MINASKGFFKVFSIFFVILFITTFGLLNGYFEQDEWLGIARIMRGYTLPWWDIFVPGQIHFSPVGVLIWEILYKTFKLQASFFYLIELIIHASVATLVYILTLRLTNNKMIAAMTGVLFLLNGRAHQGFTHLAILHTTTMAMFFILLFFVYLTGIKEKVLKLKNIIFLFLIFLLAVCTREEGFIILPLFITYLLAFNRSKINKKNILFYGLFCIGVIVFLGIRFYAQTLYKEPIPVQYQITGKGAEYNLLTLPPKYIVQNLIHSDRIAEFFQFNYQKIYPNVVSYPNTQAPFMDVAVFYIFSLIVIICLLWIWLIKPKRIGSVLIFCLVWIGANAFMLSFVGRHISELEPRYLYFSSFPVLFLFCIFIFHLFNFEHKLKIVNIICKSVAILFILTFIFSSFEIIRNVVDFRSKSGIAKKRVLDNIQVAHPQLKKNTIFYIKCKDKCYRNSEFGLPTENVLPFSSGPGLNILVSYASDQHEEKEWGVFFTHEFLFHLFSEDYKKIGDRSFGYFTTKSKLENTLKKYNLSKDIVVALEYNEENFTFKDISKEFRKTLK